jgi:hypothetical protein
MHALIKYINYTVEMNAALITVMASAEIALRYENFEPVFPTKNSIAEKHSNRQNNKISEILF